MKMLSGPHRANTRDKSERKNPLFALTIVTNPLISQNVHIILYKCFGSRISNSDSL